MTTPDPQQPATAEATPPVARLVGAVLCGGRSSRFGSDKALAPFRTTTVGGRVVAALRGGGVDPVVAIGGDAGDSLGLPTVPDRRPGDGPLGGLATALLWARTGWVLVVPCDLPLLEPEHIRRLLATEPAPDQAVVAMVEGRPKISVGVWPASQGRLVLRLVDGGERRFRAALDHIGWRGVELPVESLADADTPEDLNRLEQGAP